MTTKPTISVPVLPIAPPAYSATNENQTRAAITGGFRATQAALNSLTSGAPGTTVITASGDTTGATDTAAIQAAINSGQNVLLAPGVFYTNATLNVTARAANGVTISGSAQTDGSLNGGGATIIRPTSAVSVFMLVDGSGYGGYMQGFRAQNFTLDMVNMPTNAIGIKQLQAFDCSYDRVRGVNDSHTKTVLYFGPGAYTSEARNIQGFAVQIIGTGVNDPTTITLINPDIQQFDATWTANIQLIGGAIQPVYYSGMTIVYVAANSASIPMGLPTGAGCYLALGGYVSNSDSITVVGTDFEQGGGFPSTYNDGTHGSLNLYPVFQVGGNCTRSHFINPLFAGMYLYDINNSTTYSGANAGGGTPMNLNRTQTWFDVQTLFINGQPLKGYSDRAVTQTFLIDPSTGGTLFTSTRLTPATDGGNVLYVTNAAGANLIDVNTHATAQISFSNGMNVVGYSDNESTATFQFRSATGFGGFGTGTAGTVGQNYITVTGANGTVSVGNAYYVGPTQVLGQQITGWGTPSGGSRSSGASYAGTTQGATYSQTNVQATDNAVKLVSQQLMQLIADLKTHGLIGT